MFHSLLSTTSKHRKRLRRARSHSALLLLSFLGISACTDAPESTPSTSHSSVSEQILRLQTNEDLDDRALEDGLADSNNVQTQVPPDTPRAVGPIRDLRGSLKSRGSQRSEVGCEVRSGDSVAYTDESGSFVLEAVPSAGQVRLRMSCRGHIERQRVLIPAGVGTFELEEPLIVGPRAHREEDGEAGNSDNRRSVSIAQAIRQMDEEREDDDGETSVLRTAIRGLTNFAGTAAAVSTAGEEERYRVLGHWKRAEEEAAAQAGSDDDIEIAVDDAPQQADAYSEPDADSADVALEP